LGEESNSVPIISSFPTNIAFITAEDNCLYAFDMATVSSNMFINFDVQKINLKNFQKKQSYFEIKKFEIFSNFTRQ
jgi:predicted lipase